ncbi:TPA: DNA topoisomerase III, partial [Salmonella enterica]|nr:DNA topoisomerase III [Salmonella enterica]
VDEVVIATDADREGEVIARELLDYCKFQGRIFRLWMSALDDASIRAALSDLWPSSRTEALYYAGVGRSRADWLIGMNLTRLFTLKGREAGIGNVLSVGRV